MTIHTETNNRTEHLLALTARGDDLFNVRQLDRVGRPTQT